MATQQLYRIVGVPVIRAGEYRDMHGRPFALTDDKGREMFGRYSPEKHEARVKLGHTNDGREPSIGYVEKAYWQGGYGLADYAGLSEDAVNKLMRAGSHARRSIEVIDLDGEYLGDVAQMGAQRPAVKGLPHIRPEQVQPMSADEVMAFAERTPAATESYGFLFSEEDPESTTEEQEPNMANDENTTQLAEENGTLKAQLAEHERKLAETERKLAEKEQAEARLLAETRFNEAKEGALKFAEGTDIKPKLGAVETEAVARIIAHARLNCPEIQLDGKSLNFGEAIEKFIEQLPKDVTPPTGALKLGDEKPEGPDKPAMNFSERTKEMLADMAEKYGEDSKEYKAGLAAAETATAQLTEAK